jgi:hypothetical protein
LTAYFELSETVFDDLKVWYRISATWSFDLRGVDVDAGSITDPAGIAATCLRSLADATPVVQSRRRVASLADDVGAAERAADRCGTGPPDQASIGPGRDLRALEKLDVELHRLGIEISEGSC